MNNRAENLITDEQYWIKKIQDTSMRIHQSFSPYDISLKSVKKERKIRQNINIFEFANDIVLGNANIILKALEKRFIEYKDISPSLQYSKSFNMRFLSENPYSSYINIPDEIMKDDDIFRKCLEVHPSIYLRVNFYPHLYPQYRDPEVIKDLIKINHRIYPELSKSLQANISIAQVALVANLGNIEYMDKKITSQILKDKDLCNQLLSHNIDNFKKIHNKFRRDEDFLLPWLKKYPMLIKFASKELREKRNFIIHAASYYDFLKYIPEEMKKDRELMKIHLKSNLYSHKDIDNYQPTKPLIIECIKESYHVYERLTDFMKTDPDYIYSVLMHDTFWKKNTINSVSILEILPYDIKNEMMTQYKKLNINSKDDTELNQNLLAYTRDYYSNLYLSKNLEKKSAITKIKI